MAKHADTGRAVAVFEAHVAYLRGLLSRGTGSIQDRDGVFTFRSPAPLPFLVNGAARTDPSVAPDTVLTTAADFFGESGFEILCLDGRDDDLRAAAEAAGYRAGSADPLQHIGRMPAPSPLDRTAFDIRLAQDASDVDTVTTIAIDAHAVYRFPEDFFPEVFRTPETILSPDIRAVIISSGGMPLATAQAFLTGTAVYIGWVAVVRAAARQGLGRLATWEAASAGFAAGATD